MSDQKQNKTIEELRTHILLGVVHEMNNPNTFIRMNTINLKQILNLLKPCFDEFDKNHPHTKFGPYLLDQCLEKIDMINKANFEATERLISITSKLKQTAAASLEPQKEIDLLKIFNNLAEEQSALFKDKIKIEIIPKADQNFKIAGHELQLEQAFRVILSNAMEAITTRIEGEPNHEGHITVGMRIDGENVVLNIDDNGCGMDQVTREKIFQPFYTTKGAGRSRGLGMALCQQIITVHGGMIQVRSQRDLGTNFLITLPIK